MKSTFADLLVGDIVVAVRWDGKDARLLTITKTKLDLYSGDTRIEFNRSYFQRVKYINLSGDELRSTYLKTPGGDYLYVSKEEALKFLKEVESERMDHLLWTYDKCEKIVSDPNTVPSLRRQEEKTLQGTTKKLLVTEERYKRLYEEIGD